VRPADHVPLAAVGAPSGAGTAASVESRFVSIVLALRRVGELDGVNV